MQHYLITGADSFGTDIHLSITDIIHAREKGVDKEDLANVIRHCICSHAFMSSTSQPNFVPS